MASLPLPSWVQKLGERVQAEIIEPFHALDRFRAEVKEWLLAAAARRRDRSPKPAPDKRGDITPATIFETGPANLADAFFFLAVVRDAACPDEPTCEPHWGPEEDGKQVSHEEDCASAAWASTRDRALYLQDDLKDTAYDWFERVKADGGKTAAADRPLSKCEDHIYKKLGMLAGKPKTDAELTSWLHAAGKKNPITGREYSPHGVKRARQNLLKRGLIQKYGKKKGHYRPVALPPASNLA